MGKKTILLVEDDDVVRNMLKGTLEREYRILEASTCSEAIRQIRNCCDLAILDYNLRDGDGFDVLKEIRETNPSLPIIFMTAYSTENMAIKALRANVTHYIRKPLSFACLRGKLSEILEGKENKEPSETLRSRELFIMDSIATFIEDNYKENLTLERVSKLARMDRFRFCRAFKKRFGTGFVAYLNKTRVKNAAPLLRESFLSITDIGLSVGFSSGEYFSRVFRKTCGISPGKYRSQKEVEFHLLLRQ